jgi:hypothetical protein
MKLLEKIAIGAAAACAFSGIASAQVRTYGPAAPYLVTGRSVSVLPFADQDERKGRDADLPGALDSDAPSGHDSQSSPSQTR